MSYTFSDYFSSKHTLQSWDASSKEYNLCPLWPPDFLHEEHVGCRSSRQNRVSDSPCSLQANGLFLRCSIKKLWQDLSSEALMVSSALDDGWQQRGHSQSPPPLQLLSTHCLQNLCLQKSTTGCWKIFPHNGQERSSSRCLEDIASLRVEVSDEVKIGLLCSTHPSSSTFSWTSEWTLDTVTANTHIPHSARWTH